MNTNTKIPITVIVSVKNEELNLPYCLEKLHPFSEVIVVDSQSTDRTPTIVKEFDFKLVDFRWNGQFPKKRNWALQNVNIKHNWVLFLDADEFVTESFLDEIQDTINSTKHSGFWIFYNNYFLGKEQKYGLKMRKLALFKKDAGLFEKIEEDSWSHLDMEVHEHPEISGSVGNIKNTIIHKDFKSLEHYISRHNAYSTWEAKRYMFNKVNGFSNLTFRQKLKYNLLSSGMLPLIYFIGTFIFKLGILDGMSGYYFAKYKAHYFFQIQTKIKELNKIKL
ncbi:glycosyltransferase family 2 protein [Algibacter mikhailovii]|uniref:Alpha-L-glycero-D-manno-heptose beta-1,4-glucosyltransferase n=1 Tax=Algibacter mikhailovii TaxID=425498 RepID=A0A918VFM0_9FLAO|nr:glycosyltransferase family 2 protein [Algibacter mikhailovii]GGZ93553.1 alpha-L-glycero-D-manno-heptose beta-1,4-glucosyltransferase [Algibacter mikhailovii]